MIAVRPSEPADIPAMAAIRALEWETEAYWLNRIGAYLSGSQSPQQGLQSRAAFVAVDGVTVVGFVAGHRTRRFGCEGELEWINVIRERRGEGIAGQLIVRMAEWFAARTTGRICVNVEPDNAAGRELYRRFGANPFGQYPLSRYWMAWENARQMRACSDR